MDIIQFFNSLLPQSTGERTPVQGREDAEQNLRRQEALKQINRAEAMSDPERIRQRVDAVKGILSPITGTQGAIKQAGASAVQRAIEAGQAPSATVPIDRPIIPATPQDNIYGEVGVTGSPAMSEFINAQVQPPRFAAMSSSPNMEEVNADNLMLAQLASPTTPDGTPKDPGKFASDMAARSTVVGLAGGRDNAEYNNQKSLLSDTANSISGLLGDFDFKGLLRVLARPEFVAPMGPGQSPITNFVNAAAADRTARADSSKENRKLAAKEAMEQFNRSMRQGELSVKERKLALDQARLDKPQSIAMTEANVKNIGNMVYSLYTDDIENLSENDPRVKSLVPFVGGDMTEGEVRKEFQSAIATQAIGLIRQNPSLTLREALAMAMGKGSSGAEASTVDEFAPNSK